MYALVWCFIKHGQEMVDRIMTPRKLRANSKLTLNKSSKEYSEFHSITGDFDEPNSKSTPKKFTEFGSRLSQLINRK